MDIITYDNLQRFKNKLDAKLVAMIDGGFIVKAPSVSDFPGVGKTTYMYYATREGKFYNWNTTSNAYEVIHFHFDAIDVDIEIIDGGNA